MTCDLAECHNVMPPSVQPSRLYCSTQCSQLAWWRRKRSAAGAPKRGDGFSEEYRFIPAAVLGGTAMKAVGGGIVEFDTMTLEEFRAARGLQT